MKRMFGEVRPYSFQKKADVVETKVEKEVVAETNKLKDAVQKVEDNDNVPHNSNSIVPPSTSTTTTCTYIHTDAHTQRQRHAHTWK